MITQLHFQTTFTRSIKGMQGKEKKPIWFYFLFFSLGPLWNLDQNHLKVYILKTWNMQFAAKSGERKKFRISEESRARNLQKAFSYFNDDVYTRISYLVTLSKIFVADLYRHESCYVNYIGKLTRATSVSNTLVWTIDGEPPRKNDICKNYFPFIKSMIVERREISLFGTRNMVK